MAKKQQENIVIKGKAKWAFVSQPEKWDGQPTGYSIQVEMPKEQLDKLKNFIENFWEEHKSDLDKTLNPKGEFLSPIKEDAEGNEIVKARTSYSYKNRKTGEEVIKTIPIFKLDGTPYEKGLLIGNGSDVRVSVTPAVVYVNSKRYGVQFYLNAVQVVDLVEYHAEQSASSYGFETVEASEDEVEF